MPAGHSTRPYENLLPLRPFAGIILILFMIFALLPIGHAAEKHYSMQIQGKKLADVCQDLSQLSGSKIVFDKAWADMPITVRFVNLTLERALTKILTNLNHVVIFEPGSVQIKIYGAVTPDKGDYMAPAVQPLNRATDGPRIRPLLPPPQDNGWPDGAVNKSTAEETAEAEPIENTEKEDIEPEEEITPEDAAEDTEEKETPEENQEGEPENETDSLEDDKESEN